MSNFIKLSELKEKKLKDAEMNEVKGGYTLALMYGVMPDLKDLPF
jgi:natural product precursor